MDHGVALGGFMGVGKSTVGRLLAERLALPFRDLDAVVAAEAGMSVARIFAEEGEAGFRHRESAAVDWVVEAAPAVIALGGGTLHHGDNLVRLRPRFFVVSLTASLDIIAGRIGADAPGRPLWADAARLYADREAGYAAADAVVPVDRATPMQVVDAVMAVLPC